MSTITITLHDPDPAEVVSVTATDTDDVAEIMLEDSTEWIVAIDAEAAGKLVRARWTDMAEHDTDELRAIIGDKVLALWALGKSAGPGEVRVTSWDEWLDLIEGVPHEELASYDGDELEAIADEDAVAELGFAPTVAYRVN